MNDQERAATNEEQWQRRNEAYLGAALRWLRVRLERLAGSVAGALAESPTPSEADLAHAAAVMDEAVVGEPPPALPLLAERFQLTRFEAHVLLLCTALEFDTRIAALCARAQDDPSRAYPTFALAMALFDDPAWSVLSPERPLRYWRLIEITQPGAEPLTTSALRADERIVNYVKGLNYLDDRLTPLLEPFDGDAPDDLPPSQRAACADIDRILRQSSERVTPPVVQLVGADALSKQLVSQRAARDMGLVLYRLPVELLPAHPAELETLARLWKREGVLLPVGLYLDAHDHEEAPAKTDRGESPAAPPLQRFLSRCQGVFLLSTREVRGGLGAVHAVEIGKPTAEEQRATWHEHLGPEAGDTPGLLAGQFDLNASTVGQIVRENVGGDASGSARHERLWEGCLRNTAPRLDRLVRRLSPVATWDDIVLPEDETGLLRQLASQVAQRSRVYDDWGFRRRMNRGLGISALFAGESGTGKTMAAEVIANHLRLHLYRIDLSAVVSKYIGETEKNLRQLFDAAEDGGAILFFDEADALFGKRSEVRDSHDRYANIEVNYLLQRMEAYRGLAILATNMKGALDEAFMRRLRFIVTFPFPGRAQRRAIWQRAWPAETPRVELDYDHLARLSLTGGSIANVALNAAFASAERGTPVTMARVLEAAHAEHLKLELPIRDAEFRLGHAGRPARPACEALT